MKPLSVLLIYLVVMLPIVIVHDTLQGRAQRNEQLAYQYQEGFQTAVDDAGAYLAMLEAQQVKGGVRYGKEKQFAVGNEVYEILIRNIAAQFMISHDAAAIQNLKMHMPATVLIRYDGYILVTLEDTASASGSRELKPIFWPIRPYSYTTPGGKIIYFTLDDQITVYDPAGNRFYQGRFKELTASGLSLNPISDSNFWEVQQEAITATIEKDMAAAVNRHMEMIKRMGLSVRFSLNQSMAEQSIGGIGIISLLQGYPLPGGDRLEAIAFGGGGVAGRRTMVGTEHNSNGRLTAYPTGCTVPPGVTKVEVLFDPIEAVKKGYFIEECE
ncbi:hypothetical protein [Paenibacillus turpanensis]|uniref:hypothetical protein n=1 Tax=Paenibacillus turpanensis TaxID=2689078 RepID=UPI00140BF0CD|nr:hypothetical protein [Paenibacillus turpanensis]